MKQLLATITLVFGLFATGWAQSNFVVSGKNNISVGQIFAIPTVTTDASSTPGVQQGYVVTANYEDDRCEGYAYTGHGFSLPSTANPVDTLLTRYEDERSQLGYDSITNLTLYIHLTKHTKDTTIFLADYDDPRFGTASGHHDVTYTASDFGCDSVVDLLVYRMSVLDDVERTAGPGYYNVDVTMNTPAIDPSDFYAAGGTLTPVSDATYTASYPTGTTTPVVWTATIADSSATFTHNVIINEPDCSILHPQDGSGNTYDAVRLIHDCWLKKSLRSELYGDAATAIPETRNYPGADVNVYGLLYTYDAATGYGTPRNDTLQGSCPNGWHLPTEQKMAEVFSYFEPADLMASENWLNPGTNTTGFSMQPSGLYNSSTPYQYQDLLVSGVFWVYTPGSSVYHFCQFGSACSSMEVLPGTATMGLSIRCIKDRE